MYRDVCGNKVYGSFVVTLLDQTSMLKWQDQAQLVVTPKDTCYDEIWTTCSKYRRHFRFRNQHKLGGHVCDDLKRKKILNLTTYQYCI